MLVATVAAGVNADRLWPLVEMGLRLGAHVRGVHFQLMSSFGHVACVAIDGAARDIAGRIAARLGRNVAGANRWTDFHPQAVKERAVFASVPSIGESEAVELVQGTLLPVAIAEACRPPLRARKAKAFARPALGRAPHVPGSGSGWGYVRRFWRRRG